MSADETCWSVGPRIGNEDDRPRCKLKHPHNGRLHRPDPEDGWGNLSWGEPAMRRVPRD